MFLKRLGYRILEVVARRAFASRLIPEGRAAGATQCAIEWENGDRWLVDLSAPYGCRIRRSASCDLERARRDVHFEPAAPVSVKLPDGVRLSDIFDDEFYMKRGLAAPGSCKAHWSPILFLHGMPVAYWCDRCQGIHDFR